MNKQNPLLISNMKGLNWKYSTEALDTPSPYKMDMYGLKIVEVMNDMSDKPTQEELKNQFLEAMKSGDLEGIKSALEGLSNYTKETNRVIHLTSQGSQMMPTSDEISKNLDFDLPNWDDISFTDLI